MNNLESYYMIKELSPYLNFIFLICITICGCLILARYLISNEKLEKFDYVIINKDGLI